MKRELFVLFTSAALLMGCGGGGGGGGTPTPQSLYSGSTSAVDITNTNIGEVASTAHDSSSLMWDIEMPTVVGVATTGETTQIQLTEITDRLTDFVLGLESIEASMVAGASYSASGSCDGGVGRVSISGNINDPLVSGDYLTITFNNCNLGGAIFDGVFALTINSAVGPLYLDQPTPTIWELVASYSFDRLTTTFTGGSVMIHGGFTFTVGEDSATTGHGGMQGNALYVRAGADEALLTAFDFQAKYNATQSYDIVSDYTIASTEIGGVITVDTDNAQPFAINNGENYPYVGDMTISSATGASIELSTIDKDWVMLTWDLVAPYGTSEGSDTVQWVNLDSYTIP
jgi:hypothetical protein